MIRLLIMLGAIAATSAIAGPLSKFDKKPPVASYSSRADLYDIERCLIDMDMQTPPFVYAQPDRPDQVTLVWESAASAVGRTDLKREDKATHITTWSHAAQVQACAPPRG